MGFDDVSARFCKVGPDDREYEAGVDCCGFSFAVRVEDDPDLAMLTDDYFRKVVAHLAAKHKDLAPK